MLHICSYDLTEITNLYCFCGAHQSANGFDLIESIGTVSLQCEFSTEGRGIAISSMTIQRLHGKEAQSETHCLLDWRRAACDCSIHSSSQRAEGLACVVWLRATLSFGGLAEWDGVKRSIVNVEAFASDERQFPAVRCFGSLTRRPDFQGTGFCKFKIFAANSIFN